MKLYLKEIQIVLAYLLLFVIVNYQAQLEVASQNLAKVLALDLEKEVLLKNQLRLCPSPTLLDKLTVKMNAVLAIQVLTTHAFWELEIETGASTALSMLERPFASLASPALIVSSMDIKRDQHFVRQLSQIPLLLLPMVMNTVFAYLQVAFPMMTAEFELMNITLDISS